MFIISPEAYFLRGTFGTVEPFLGASRTSGSGCGTVFAFVFLTASATLSNTGTPWNSVPPRPGVTPPTSGVPPYPSGYDSDPAHHSTNLNDPDSAHHQPTLEWNGTEWVLTPIPGFDLSGNKL